MRVRGRGSSIRSMVSLKSVLVNDLGEIKRGFIGWMKAAVSKLHAALQPLAIWKATQHSPTNPSYFTSVRCRRRGWFAPMEAFPCSGEFERAFDRRSRIPGSASPDAALPMSVTSVSKTGLSFPVRVPKTRRSFRRSVEGRAPRSPRERHPPRIRPS